MTPVEKAAQLYLTMPAVRTFKEDLEAHLLHGIVHSSSAFFMLCRYVHTGWSHEEMENPWHNPKGPRDCLLIYLASGDIKEFFTLPHDPVKWVAFSRRGRKPRVYPFKSIQTRIQSWHQS